MVRQINDYYSHYRIQRIEKISDFRIPILIVSSQEEIVVQNGFQEMVKDKKEMTAVKCNIRERSDKKWKPKKDSAKKYTPITEMTE